MLHKNNPSNTVENSALVVGTNVGQINLKKFDEKPCIWCDYCNKPRHTCELARKFMVNQQIGRGCMKAGSIVLLLHMRLNLFTLTEQMDDLLKLLKSNFGLSSISNTSLAQTGND